MSGEDASFTDLEARSVLESRVLAKMIGSRLVPEVNEAQAALDAGSMVCRTFCRHLPKIQTWVGFFLSRSCSERVKYSMSGIHQRKSPPVRCVCVQLPTTFTP